MILLMLRLLAWIAFVGTFLLEVSHCGRVLGEEGAITANRMSHQERLAFRKGIVLRAIMFACAVVFLIACYAEGKR